MTPTDVTCIPKGSAVVNNVWTIHIDPSRYPNPEVFLPERWQGRLQNDKENLVDAKTDLVAFGAGRRICPGQHVAERSVFIDPQTFTDRIAVRPVSFKASIVSRDPFRAQVIRGQIKSRARAQCVNGPLVTCLGYGAMGLSTAYGSPKTDEDRFAMLDHVYESGVRFWDTSDSYGDSEDLLGRWFKRNPGAREGIFLATKFGVYRNPETDERSFRNDPEYIKQACKKSLDLLGIDHIDLYYCHRIQTDQPIEITVLEMKKLQDAGKIKYLGLSECSANTLRRACKVAQISAVQIEYSPFSMDIEDPGIGLLAACRELNVAVVAYSPLGRGFLTGAVRSPGDFKPGDSRKAFPRFSEENFSKNLKLVDDITTLANEKGCTPAQLVLAFLQAQGDIIPIPGSTNQKNWDENLGCIRVVISSEDNDKIRKAITASQVHGHRLPLAFSQSLFADTALLET